MNWKSWLTLGVTALLVSCSSQPNSKAPVTQPTVGNVPASVGTAQNGNGQTPVGKTQGFANPVVSPTATVDVPAVPGLLRPTNAKARLPGIATGRPDPFASLTTPPIKISAASKASSPLNRPRPVSALPSIPTIPITPLQAIPLTSPGALPSLPLPSAPLSRTAIADAIEITGAVQLGGKWSVIVKEPDAQTSRYVKAGEFLGNGQVLVKRIVAGVGSDPIVILQQNGIEVTKSLGSSSGPIASK